MCKNNEPFIGLWHDSCDSWLTTLPKLKVDINYHKSVFTLKQYLDWRCNTNMTRFNYDPFTGQRIDWNAMRKEQQ